MKSKWIKKGDKVLVISGNDLGKVGTVLSLMKNRLIIQGVNIRKKHSKSRSEERKSEIISIEMPIHISNVALCNGDGKKLKLKSEKNEKGEKELFYFDKDKKVTYRTLKKKMN